MPIDGRKILDEILSTPEFEVEVYTPKHSCNFSLLLESNRRVNALISLEIKKYTHKMSIMT